MTNAEQDVSRAVDNYGMAGVLRVMVTLYGQLEVTQSLQHATQVAHKATMDSKPYDVGS